MGKIRFGDYNLVSVIIPVYNRAGLIEKTLQNIWENKYRPIEIVAVNDGSTDNTLEVLQKFKNKHEKSDFFIKIINQANSGAPSARNRGFLNSRGAYIQFLDSDDFIHEDKFLIQINLLKNGNEDFALCDFSMKFTATGNEKYCSNEQKLLKIIFPSGSFGCASALIKRNLASKLSWNIKLYRNQDMDYFLRAALMANKIVYIKKILYYYIMHGENRISDIYTSSSPVFSERIKSLIKTKVKTRNIFFKYIAILLMGLELTLWHILKLLHIR